MAAALAPPVAIVMGSRSDWPTLAKAAAALDELAVPYEARVISAHRTPERLVRFLVVLPERAELVRHKLERSPLLRTELEEGDWHIVKANHLRAWASHEEVALADMEALLGLDPATERTGDQLALFGG